MTDERQLELLRRMAALEPAPHLMGGWAKDALLAGTATRPHDDFDWLLPRRELELRLGQARDLGFEGFETIGEAAPGEPFYLAASGGGQKLELGVCDDQDGALWMKVHALAFEGAVGWRARLPDDTFAHPPAAIDGIVVRVVSPLALYRIEVALASRGSFGELSDRHRETTGRLRERFLADHAEAELEPHVEPLR